MMNSGESVADIVVPESIDHLLLWGLIKSMAILKPRSPCLNVVAVDAASENPADRDEWMADRLAYLAKDTPIVMLIGALHTLKKVDWRVK